MWKKNILIGIVRGKHSHKGINKNLYGKKILILEFIFLSILLMGFASAIVPFCGDGILRLGVEECDDGNLNNADGCNTQCQIIHCYNNLQCGTLQSNKFCSERSVIYNLTQFTCNNPGTANSYCSSSTNQVPVSCGIFSSALICQDNDVYNRTTNPLCVGEGFCTAKNITTLVQDCGTSNSRLECVGNNVTNITSIPGCSTGSCFSITINNTVEQCPTGTSNLTFCVGNVSITTTTNFLGCGSANCLNETQMIGEFCEFGCSQGICQNRTEYCGDGILYAVNETCDNGTSNGNVCVPGYGGSCSYCNNSCGPVTLYGAVCGDNVKNIPYEECDGSDGVGLHQVCSQECELIDLPFCGDGLLYELNETCDNGTANGNVCVPGYGSSCSYCNNTCGTITLYGAFCGDGFLDEGEECDDGNILNGDGCSSICKQVCEHDVGVRYTYSNGVGTGIAIKPVDGSWLLDDPEELIKGRNYTVKYLIDNKIANSTNFIHVVVKIGEEILANYSTSINAYDSKEVSLNISELEYQNYNVTVFVEKVNETDCNTTDNFAWREFTIIPQCGNNFLDDGEECDGLEGVGPHQTCSQECELINLPFCGNNITDSGEQCDDGNNIDGDGCNAQCSIEQCGNSIIDFGEQCDNGTANGDACVPAYENSCNYCDDECDSIILNGPFCGDDVMNIPDEECDGLDGVGLHQNCTEECTLDTLPFCGDGFLDYGEECDDGNNIDGDRCSANCVIEKECTEDSDCNDELFCNGEEICNLTYYECESGIPPEIDDDLFCTEDICDESTDSILHNPLDVSDDISCTEDVCDEEIDEIIHQENNSYCDNGLFCDGNEYCDSEVGCQEGIVFDCSEFDLPEIEVCDNNPDNNPFTLDFAPDFTSICNERTDSCTTGIYEFIHTCDSNMCDAECELGETDSVPCGTDVGECEFGEITLQCESNCSWESIIEKTCEGGITPAAEICDEKDNDCDGQVDEGLLEDFNRISYSTIDTGEVILLNGYSEFTEENVDFFHGQVYERYGEYFGYGSMHARGTSTNGTEVQLNVKFRVTGLVEIDCEKITWRNSASGTYWIKGEGTQDVTYDYMDITYYFATGKIDTVGVDGTDFEFIDMIDQKFTG